MSFVSMLLEYLAVVAAAILVIMIVATIVNHWISPL